MKRLLTILVFLALVTTLLVPAALPALCAPGDDCEGACPDESGSDGPCVPCCSCCACCLNISPFVVIGDDAIRPFEMPQLRVAERTAAIPTPTPDDISHVPKLSRV